MTGVDGLSPALLASLEERLHFHEGETTAYRQGKTGAERMVVVPVGSVWRMA